MAITTEEITGVISALFADAEDLQKTLTLLGLWRNRLVAETQAENAEADAVAARQAAEVVKQEKQAAAVATLATYRAFIRDNWSG